MQSTPHPEFVTTILLRVDPQHPASVEIERAAALIRQGRLVAFPTETVYGLGANALDGEAVARIFRAKARPSYDPLIVHVADLDGLLRVVTALPPTAEKLVAAFWPGPLTLVLPRHSAVPLIVTGGGETVAVRMPAHPVALQLIKAAGVPIAAPSANRFGKVSPTRADHVLADLDGRIDMLLDAGPTPVGVESTVLSLMLPVPTLLRPGGISLEALQAALGEIRLPERSVQAGTPLQSPGTLEQHYAPRAALVLFQGPRAAVLAAMHDQAIRLLSQGERIGLLVGDEDAAEFAQLPVKIQIVGPAADLQQVAQGLFASLRSLDDAGVTLILARDFGSSGLGRAIRDRLTRAAGGRVVSLGSSID